MFDTSDHNAQPEEALVSSENLPRAFDDEHGQSTVHGGTRSLKKSPKALRSQEGPLYFNYEGLTEPEIRIQRAIQDFWNEHGTLPSRNFVQRQLRCKAETVSSVLARVRRDFDRAERQTVYIDRFIFKKKSTLRKKFLRKTRALLDNAMFALWKCFPDCTLLTFVTPSDSEIAYLAICDSAKSTAVSLIERLLPDEADPLSVWRWECQQNGRLHLHVIVPLHVSDSRISISKLKKAWFKILDELDEQTRCNPLVTENGVNVRLSGSWVHAKEFSELPNANAFPNSYLGTVKKHGHSNIAQRSLSILDGKYIAPCVHGGVSPALQAIAEKLTFEKKVAIHCATDAGDMFKAFQELIPADVRGWHPWQKPFVPGLSCRIEKQDFDKVADIINDFAPFTEEELSRAPFHCVLKLTPDRRFSIYSYKNVNYSPPRKRRRRAA